MSLHLFILDVGIEISLGIPLRVGRFFEQTTSEKDHVFCGELVVVVIDVQTVCCIDEFGILRIGRGCEAVFVLVHPLGDKGYYGWAETHPNSTHWIGAHVRGSVAALVDVCRQHLVFALMIV